jgi:eukaryotic-like serine/threonine-protein kinase
VKPADPPHSSAGDSPAALVDPPRALADTVAAQPLSGVDPSPAPATPDAFSGRYEVHEKLGEGGMGEVHLAMDNRIGREVALKAVHYGFRDRPDFHRRFVREARVQGQLEHPSIVPVYELSLDGDAPYFTMRRVRGVTLEEIVEGLRTGDADMGARFSRRRLLTAWGNVCLAVDFAHARGVVHRDLKPSNVMLGDFGEVYVLDWGVAKVGDLDDAAANVTVDAGELAAKTEAGSLMGTLGYISPEQLRGETVTPRADVYALGAILFEILALEPLHPRGRTTEIVKSTLEGADARTSVRALGRDVPPELEVICVRATALDPKDRFSSARELHEAVERFLDGDRDIEHRRDLAREHARRALAAALRITSIGSEDSDGDRTVALREAARSLALDPTNTEAMEATLRLCARPPRGVSAEVERRVGESIDGVRRSNATYAAVTFAVTAFYFPLLFLMGLKEPSFLVATIVLLAISGLTMVARARSPREGQIPILIVTTTLLWSLQARIAGPFVMLPGLIVANTVAYAMLESRTHRWLAVLAGCAALVIPALLEWTGTFGSAYLFRDGTITIFPRALSLPKGPTLLYFTATGIGAMLAPFLYVGRLRANFYAMQRGMTRQIWQFRQLVPEPIHEVLGGSATTKESEIPRDPRL